MVYPVRENVFIVIKSLVSEDITDPDLIRLLNGLRVSAIVFGKEPDVAAIVAVLNIVTVLSEKHFIQARDKMTKLQQTIPPYITLFSEEFSLA